MVQKIPRVFNFWHPPKHSIHVLTVLVFLLVVGTVHRSTAQQYYTVPANALDDDSPRTVEIAAQPGDLVSVDPSSVLDARTEWVVPEQFKQYQVDPQSGTIYIATPKGPLEFILVISPNDLDKRLQIRRFRIGGGGHPDPDDDDTEPTPDPTPDPSGEYDGLNTYGIGGIAYKASQGVSGDRLRMSLGILETGRDHLQGKNGTVLFIDSPDSERNVFRWMELSSSDWFDPVVQEMEKLKSPEMRLADWIKVFQEAEAGIREALK